MIRPSLAHLLTLALLAGPLLAQTPPPGIESEALDDPPPAAVTDELTRLERLAERSFEEDDLDTAIVLYQQLAERVGSASERARVLKTVAWLEHLSGRDLAAREALTQALLEDPSQPFQAELYSQEFLDLYYDAEKTALETREAEADARLRSGIDAMRRGDYPRAGQLLDEALAAMPDQPTALYNRALVDLHQKRHEDALAGFQKILALGQTGGRSVTPKIRALALTNIGYLYNVSQQYDEAEDALNEAVELDPKNGQAWTNLGTTWRQLGRRPAAAEAFRKAHEVSPNDPSAINNLAIAYMDAGDWVAAVGLLAEAARRLDDPKMWMNLGRAQAGMGNPQGAVSSFEAAIRTDPTDAKGIASASAVDLARLYFERGDFGRSLEQAERAVALRPDLVDGWIYQGLAQRELDRFAEAQRSFEEARRLDPTRPEIHNNLGSVYFELDQLDLAEDAFRRALAIQPGFAEAEQNLKAVRTSRNRGQLTRSPLPGTASAPPPRSGSSPPPPPPAPRLPVGLRFADIDYSALGLKGVMVDGVDPGSAAERAGIRKNDLILKVDGRDVTSAEGFLDDLRTAGDRVTIDLLRENRPQRLEMRLR